MKTKSITKRGSRAAKGCPREDLPVRGNSPDWYTRENLPYRGENFNALTSLRPQPGVMFEDGVSTAVATTHSCIIHPPVDQLDSFYKKAADFYAEIREKNSGAANYNTMYLAAYMYDVGVLHALAHATARAIKSVRSILTASADSPYILSTLAGVNNYELTASQLAQLTNRFTILAKDIENLPLPHVTAFDRSRFLYSSFFADSKKPKPVLTAFIPAYVVVAEVTNESSEVTFASHRVRASTSDSNADFIPNCLDKMADILEMITTNNVFTIIRGDIRNAFGNTAYWEGLVALISTPLQIVPEDAEVMAQIENLSLIPRDDDAGDDIDYSYSESDSQYVLKMAIDGVNDSPSLSRVWLDNNLVNYHGVSPSDGELLAITRMMYVGRKENRLTKTDAIILASSGNTVWFTEIITDVSKSAHSSFGLSTSIMLAQNSAVQSTMKSAIERVMFATSITAHSPMVILGNSPRAYSWNLDNYAIMSNVNLHNMTIIANRSLWDVHLPRGESGRLERKA